MLDDYVILSSEFEEKLREQVLKKAKAGYKLVGGIQVALIPGARYLNFFQAMSKEEDTTDDSF
jgi:hypothetical protein